MDTIWSPVYQFHVRIIVLFFDFSELRSKMGGFYRFGCGKWRLVKTGRLTYWKW